MDNHIFGPPWTATRRSEHMLPGMPIPQRCSGCGGLRHEKATDSRQMKITGKPGVQALIVIPVLKAGRRSEGNWKLIQVTGSDLVSEQNSSSWARWRTPVIPAPERLNSRLAWSMMRPCFRKQTINNELEKHYQSTGPRRPLWTCSWPSCTSFHNTGACHHPMHGSSTLQQITAQPSSRHTLGLWLPC